MEFLKALFEAGALTFEQFTEKVTAAGMKLANLSDGGYVSKEKFENKETELKNAKTQLETANETIKGFEGLDVDGIKKQADDWKLKYEQAEELGKKTAYDMRIKAIVEKESFSSKAAKSAFTNDLIAKSFPFDGDNLLGYADFKKSYTESDPTVFAQETLGKPYQIPPIGGGQPIQMTHKDFLALGYDSRLKLKAEQPELYEQLRKKRY